MKAKRIIVLLTAMVAAICSGIVGAAQAAEATHTLTIITLPENTGVAVDTYEMETGEKWALTSPNPTDYRLLGWFQDGSLISEEYTYSFEMPDHDVTLIRRYAYDPALPGNPGSNTWYYLDDGLIELLLDNFKPGHINDAIYELQRNKDFDIDMMESIIVKGKVTSGDIHFNRGLSLKKVDFSRTNLKELEERSFKERGITTILLPSSLETIGSYCFEDCPLLNRITCLALTPPTLRNDVFKGVPEGGFLYVPAVSVDAYKEAEGWKDFFVFPVADELTPLTVSLPAACADGRCQNMRLEVVNASSGVRQKYIISNRMEYTFDLVHDCAYNVYLTTQQGEVLSQVENIKLGTTALRILLPNLKTLYDVSLIVKAPDGTDVTGQVDVKWFDKEGNYLSDGSVMTRRTEGTVLQAALILSEELARVCQLPEVVKHTVVPEGNEIAVTLSPLVTKTLGVLVVSDADGSYLGNASVQAGQQLHGRYNESASAKTDTYGACMLTLYCDVPATLTVSRDGFYNESVNIENIADLEELPTVRLKPFNGTTLTLLLHGYDDYQDLTVSVYNNTKEATVGDARLQYPCLILPEGVDDDDVLAITAHSREGRFADATQTLSVKDGSVTIDILANGNLQATYESAQNEAVRAMLYDGSGQLVETKKCEARKATFSYLPDGSYTVVMMGSSPLFAGVGSLADLDGLGLRDKVDYVKKTVTVQRGETTGAEFGVVPLFVESRYAYLSTKSSFLCTTAKPRGGYAATFRASISFKDAYADGVKNLRLIVDYDNNTEFVDGSVVLNTQLHDYAQGTQAVEIDGLQNGDEVKFCLMPKDDGILTAAAYVEFDYNSQHLRQPLGSARLEAFSFDLVVPEETPTPELTIKLRSIPWGKYQSAEFYDNGVLIGTIPDLVAKAGGSWKGVDAIALHSSSRSSGFRVGHTSVYNPKPGDINEVELKCKLNDPYYYSFHNIQAKLIATDGSQLMTKTRLVEYNPAAFVLADVGFFTYNRPATSTTDVSPARSTGKRVSYLPSTNLRVKNTIDIGCISNSLNARTYTVGPDDKHVFFNYYVHCLDNPLMPGMLKDNSVTLTKYYKDKDSGEEKTLDFRIKGFSDAPVYPHFMETSHSGYYDVSSNGCRFMDDNSHPKAFMHPENCSLDELPTNFAVDYEYADDFEFPHDTEGNNRYVKMLKAAMAEQDRLIHQLETVNQRMIEEIENGLGDLDYFNSLVDESREIAKKLNGGVEPTLTDEEKGLLQTWMDESLSEAECEEIWNRLCPDVTKTEEYQELLQWNNDCMTSSLYFPPYQLSNGIWTPSYTYIVGTPTSGNVVRDMSDGNWHLDESETDYDVFKFVYVNDKGGDRLIIDCSEHLPQNVAGSRFFRDIASSDPNAEFFESMATTAVLDFGSWGIGAIGDLANTGVWNMLCNNAAHNQTIASEALMLSEKQLAVHYTIAGEIKVEQATLELAKANKTLTNTNKLAVEAKGVGSIVGVVAGGVALGYTNYGNFNTYYDDDWQWEQLIMFAETNCGDAGKDVIDRLNEARNDSRWHNGYKIATNTVTAGAGMIASAVAAKGGGQLAILLGGLDLLVEEHHQMYETLMRKKRENLILDLKQVPGCEHLFTPAISDGITPLIDPSGYVYEAVPSNRLEGVTATCYYKDSLQNEYGDWEVHEVMWNAEDFDQVNPQLTDGQGKYGWDVPMGKWQVRYQKDGYEPTRSEWLPVPPPQLEVNIPMVQRTAPEVSMVHAYQDGVELLFSKYMQPETLTTDNLKVKVVRGSTETYLDDLKVELLNEEASAKGSTTTYASYLKLTSEKGWQGADEVVLIIDHSVKSYCGVPMQETFMQRLDVELRIEDIIVTEGPEGAEITEDTEVAMPIGSSCELKIKVVPAEAGAGKTLRIASSFTDLINISIEGTEVTEDTEGTVVLDEQGEATITLTGKTLGSAALILTIDGELITKEIIVEVLDPTDMVVKTPAATPATGTLLNVGDMVTLSTKTGGAQIYYTTDGSCPCDETSARKLYTAPIVITKQTVIKAMAVKEGWTPSEVATFVYTIKGDVNCDGAIDVADIATILSVMASWQVDELAFARADVNEDGVVDVADIASVLSIMAARARLQASMKELGD